MHFQHLFHRGDKRSPSFWHAPLLVGPGGVPVFEPAANGLGGDGLDTAPLDGFAYQPPQRPVVVAVGNWRTSDRDEVGGWLSGSCLAMARLLSAVQADLQPAREVPVADLESRGACAAERLADLGLGPPLGANSLLAFHL